MTGVSHRFGHAVKRRRPQAGNPSPVAAKMRTVFGGVAASLLLVCQGGCEPTRQAEGLSVARAWQEPESWTESEPTSNGDPPPGNADTAPTSRSGETIAVIDGRAVPRERVVEMLIRGHGAAVLEQIVVLEAARREAAARGLTVTGADVEAEYDRSLRRLLSPLPAQEEGPLDRREGERVLDRILASRNISRAEYMMGMRRNAYLRRIVDHELRFTDAQLEAEFERAYGERVKVRHIQVATHAEADQMIKRLAGGADFAGLARNYSANPNTAPSGGMLRVFSREDPDVPELMRQAAFALRPGQHSAPLKIDEWVHILKLQEHIGPSDVGFEAVRGELERRLRRRMTEPAMRQLHQSLLLQTEVDVRDPVLAEEYRKRRQQTP